MNPYLFVISPDFSPEVNNEQRLRVEKGRFLRHNCVVGT